MINLIIMIISFMLSFILDLSCQVPLTCPFGASFRPRIFIRNLDCPSFFYHLLRRISTQNLDAFSVMR
jgi:hypothetical protein